MFALYYYVHCQWDEGRQALLILSYKIKSTEVITLRGFFNLLERLKKNTPKSISHPVTEISFK